MSSTPIPQPLLPICQPAHLLGRVLDCGEKKKNYIYPGGRCSTTLVCSIPAHRSEDTQSNGRWRVFGNKLIPSQISGLDLNLSEEFTGHLPINTMFPWVGDSYPAYARHGGQSLISFYRHWCWRWRDQWMENRKLCIKLHNSQNTNQSAVDFSNLKSEFVDYFP